ncbi:translation factor GUF1, mitochondrial isoform X3 [Neopsephotus bourkii]|uniref:translation factor GUF1, mitochondrial isoform X3 n=1 Tax=Neopsephotus bourkii TaxID=309878 RepID=UPI002AA52800|nr:translation factor GUF1, mitochondrial isoform X3 [Neopsephotus bourkii]
MALAGRTAMWWARLRSPCPCAAPLCLPPWLLAGPAACERLYSSPGKEKLDMSTYPVENIRNFSIIAHVDHGKSTLADRLLEITGTIAKTAHNKQVLDKLQVERERGITVKAQSASLFYSHEGVNYLLNLIDTPGHVDFSYEVSRSLSACQGVILVVDANEGIQAQTVANFYLAFEAQLAIIPVINKIDLKHADPERVEKQIEKLFDIPIDECVRISAKQGTNVEKVLQKIIEKIPPPQCNTADPLKALVFDSTFDHYRGVIANIALFGGEIQKGHRIVSAHTKKRYEVNEVGILTPNEQSTHKLLGFLGLLHMEVFNQRLEQEYNMSVILTAPTVPYKAILSSAKLIKEHGKAEITIINPAQFPDKISVSEYLEPTVLGTIVTPQEYIGKIIVLCQDRRAVQKDMLYIDEHRVMLKYLFPLNEIVLDFYDALKSLSSGYASFDYEDAGYQAADLIKMDILLNGNPVEELATIIHSDKAYATGKRLCERLKDAIPRQLFEIAIQAAIGKRIIARETLKAYRKNVVAKCYGGDITRRMKLLKRQAEGKKLMRKIGNVEVPRDAFIRVLKREPDK